MQMQEEETLLQLFGALGGHFQVEFSYGTIPAVFITSLFFCVCVLVHPSVSCYRTANSGFTPWHSRDSLFCMK